MTLKYRIKMQRCAIIVILGEIVHSQPLRSTFQYFLKLTVLLCSNNSSLQFTTWTKAIAVNDFRTKNFKEILIKSATIKVGYIVQVFQKRSSEVR